jgi:hypothetical protein
MSKTIKETGQAMENSKEICPREQKNNQQSTKPIG